MAKFSTNKHRLDPYKNFRFRVKVGTEYVAALSKMSALKKTVEVIEWREAGDSGTVRKLPGRTKYEPITMERGVTHDPLFHDWANTVNNPAGDAANSLKGYRLDIGIEVLNAQGVPALAFKVNRAWVSEYQALGEMDANANAVNIESLKIEFEAFELDRAVVEPAET